jgi:hypothetical protein
MILTAMMAAAVMTKTAQHAKQRAKVPAEPLLWLLSVCAPQQTKQAVHGQRVKQQQQLVVVAMLNAAVESAAAVAADADGHLAAGAAAAAAGVEVGAGIGRAAAMVQQQQGSASLRAKRTSCIR